MYVRFIVMDYGVLSSTVSLKLRVYGALSFKVKFTTCILLSLMLCISLVLMLAKANKKS